MCPRLLLYTDGLPWIKHFSWGMRFNSTRCSIHGLEIRISSDQECDQSTERQEVCNRSLRKIDVRNSRFVKRGQRGSQAIGIWANWPCSYDESRLHNGKLGWKEWRRTLNWWSHWPNVRIRQIDFHPVDSSEDWAYGLAGQWRPGC